MFKLREFHHLNTHKLPAHNSSDAEVDLNLFRFNRTQVLLPHLVDKNVSYALRIAKDGSPCT